MPPCMNTSLPHRLKHTISLSYYVTYSSSNTTSKHTKDTNQLPKNLKPA